MSNDQDLADAIDRHVREYVDPAFEAIAKRLNEDAAELSRALKSVVTSLEARLSDTERKAMRFRGVHQSAEEYQRGDLVTHAGALWHCNRSTTERPGSGGTDWQLAVKSGGAA